MRVVVVDDDKLVAISLKTILEASGQVTVEALGGDGEEAISLYEQFRPEVLLMDIRMQKMTGLEAAERILQKDPEARILFLTTFSDDEYIMKSLQIGARGYILKQDFEGIVPALQAVYGGQSVFDGKVVERIPALTSVKEAFDFSKADISEKEQEIITLVAEGLSNREIADKIYLSEGTVRNYISVVLEKLNLRDRTQLAVFYYKNCV